MSCSSCAPPVYPTGLGSSGLGLTGAVGGMIPFGSQPMLVGQRSLGTFPSSAVAGMSFGNSISMPSSTGLSGFGGIPAFRSTLPVGPTSLGAIGGSFGGMSSIPTSSFGGFGGIPTTSLGGIGGSFGGMGPTSFGTFSPSIPSGMSPSFNFQASAPSFSMPPAAQTSPTSFPFSTPNFNFMPSPMPPPAPTSFPFPTPTFMPSPPPLPLTMPSSTFSTMPSSTFSSPFSFPSAPPPLMLPAPPSSCSSCDPCASFAPPPLPIAPCNVCDPLPLPAPLPPPPAPQPSVIHIKDDSGPKIAGLQAEIRRLERLLAGCKENEAGLRGELAELQGRLEFLGNKEQQTAACEAELAKLRDALLEAQRRMTFLEGQRDEAHKHIGFLENQLKNADNQIAQMGAHIKNLEGEIAHLRTRLESKTELHSRTNVHETYKVKTFEMAYKLAVMDGTDDGMYNGLPIEVEGEGLYKDLVARGRKPRENASLSGRPSSQTTTSETYKVSSFEMAEKLSKMDGTDDGKYNGLPIEVSGLGLYSDLVRQGFRPTGGARAPASIGGGTITSGAASGQQTYKVANIEMAAKISKMGGNDDGTYKGLPIEVQGMGLYRDIRGRM